MCCAKNVFKNFKQFSGLFVLKFCKLILNSTCFQQFIIFSLFYIKCLHYLLANVTYLKS